MLRSGCTCLALSALLMNGLCLMRSAAAETSIAPAAYSNHARLSQRLRDVAQRAPGSAHLTVIARSLEGREVWAIQLALPGDKPAEERAAILIVAGLDATHLVGTETAVGIAEAFIADTPFGRDPTGSASPTKATSNPTSQTTTDPSEETPTTSVAEDDLSDLTLYILPRINPDGAERFLGSVRAESDLNNRPTDDDRDGVADDDPPEDLNGDGLITMMRVRDAAATHVADPDEPRLMREADRAKGERPVYKMYAEGIDNDGDGQYNEDGLGGAAPNRNFPHAYPELTAGAGANELSEPESRVLADFVLSHPNIAAVIVYGRHDNMVHTPGDKARDVSGRGYRHLHPDDTPIYQHLSERFKELTGLAEAPKADNAGAFYAWAYNQRGLPAFATNLWWVAKSKLPKKPEEKDSTSQPTTQEAADSGKTPTTNPSSLQPATLPPFSRDPTGSASAKSGAPKKKKKDPLETDRRWIKYSDEKRDGAGFVAWTPYDHPTLGKVEIGGFVPGFRINPPIESVSKIVEKQFLFVKDIAARLPRPRVADCKVTRRSASVFEIELSMTNDAYLPTALAMAQTARVAYPFVLRLDLPAEDLLGGQRVAKIPSIGGLGATEKVRWLVRGKAGQRVTVSIYHKRFGTIEYKLRLEESNAGGTPR